MCNQLGAELVESPTTSVQIRPREFAMRRQIDETTLWCRAQEISSGTRRSRAAVCQISSSVWWSTEVETQVYRSICDQGQSTGQRLRTGGITTKCADNPKRVLSSSLLSITSEIWNSSGNSQGSQTNIVSRSPRMGGRRNHRWPGS